MDFLSSVGRFAVPSFFLISGYFFFYKAPFSWSMYGRKLRSRCKTLLLPYVLWNVVYFLLYATPKWLGISHVDTANCHFNWSSLFYMFFNAPSLWVPNGEVATLPSVWEYIVWPIDGPLWFVRDLMMVLLLAPVLHYLIKRFRFVFPLLLGLLWYGLQCFCPINYFRDQLVSALFFVSLGMYFAIEGQNMVAQIYKIRHLGWLWLVMVGLPYIVPTMEPFCGGLTILTGIVAVFSLSAWIVKTNRLRPNTFLAKSSFFVYAMHWGVVASVIGMAQKGFAVLALSNVAMQSVVLMGVYLMVPAVTVSLCLGVYALGKRWCPKTLALFTGGR